jgi:hypothetical protein
MKPLFGPFSVHHPRPEIPKIGTRPLSVFSGGLTSASFEVPTRLVKSKHHSYSFQRLLYTALWQAKLAVTTTSALPFPCLVFVSFPSPSRSPCPYAVSMTFSLNQIRPSISKRLIVRVHIFLLVNTIPSTRILTVKIPRNTFIEALWSSQVKSYSVQSPFFVHPFRQKPERVLVARSSRVFVFTSLTFVLFVLVILFRDIPFIIWAYALAALLLHPPSPHFSVSIRRIPSKIFTSSASGAVCSLSGVWELTCLALSLAVPWLRLPCHPGQTHP